MTSPTRRVWLTAVVLLLGACGSSGGGGAGGSGGGSSGGSIGRGGSGGRVGGGGSGGPGTGVGGTGGGDPTAAFTGSWTFQSGSVAPMCGAIAVAPITLTGSAATITKVDASHVAIAFTSTGLTCNVNFAVSGATATATPGQTCTITVMGTTAPVNITSWTLTSAGSMLTMSMAGTASVAIVSCMPSGTGTLVRS